MSNKLSNKLCNKHPSYLTQRNGIFYFCYRLPNVLTGKKPTLIRRSLFTRSIDEAKIRMSGFLPFVAEVKQESTGIKLSGVGGNQKGSPDTLPDITYQLVKTSIKEATREPVISDLSVLPVQHNQPNNSDQTNQSSSAAAVESNNSTSSNEMPVNAGADHNEVTVYKPKISEFIDGYLNWNRGNGTRTAKIIKDYQTQFETLLCILGDMPVTEVTKQDIRKCLKIRAGMPKRNQSPYSKWSIPETLGKIEDGFEIDDADLISDKTVKEFLKLMQSFFSAYLCKTLDVLTTSPTNGVSFSATGERYGCYSDQQMRQIVEYWKAKPNTNIKMAIMAACYTGMRRSEIANLTSTDIRFDEESQRHYIFIKSGKTAAARRIVPISNKLKDLGFIDCIKRLRPNQKLYGRKLDFIGDAFTKSRKELNMPSVDINENRLVFHSLRHSCITKLRGSNISDPLIQQVVGHQTARSITDRYTHLKPKDLLIVVDSLDWDE